tara:strand:+ start:757 stop:1209 length:453 start_codon:yes stop_codon:yes gene_type:complete
MTSNHTHHGKYESEYESFDFRFNRNIGDADTFIHQHLGILVIKYHRDTIIDRKKAIQIIEETKPMFTPEIRLVISDSRAIGLLIDHDARQIFKNYPSHKEANALAILIESLPIKILANFFINSDKPAIPTKAFRNLSPAIEWLIQQDDLL